MELLLITLGGVVLAILSVLANEVGVDSRDGFDDPHRPSYPVVMS